LVGSYGTVVLTQDGTGNRTITLPSIVGVTNKVLGSASNTTVSLSTAASAKDILNFYYDGTNCYWNIGQGYGNTAAAGLILTTTGTGAATLSGTTLNIPSVSSSVNAGSLSGTIAVANGGTGVTTSTGTGNVVLSSSPTLITPALGTPSAVVLTSATGLPLTTGVTGTLAVGNGGTGATTLTGYIKGTGTTAMTASANIPVADITGAAPLASPTFTGTVTTSTINTGALSASSVTTPIYASTPQALTDGTTISTVAVATYGYEDVQIKLVGNRMVVAVKSIATGNWNIRSSTDGTNFTEHFTSIANLTLIGGANGILLGAVGTSSRNLVQYNLSNNTSSVLGTGAFYNLNPSPAIDDTNLAAPIFYLAMAPTSTSGYFLYKTTLTTSGASALTAIGSAWVRVINRKSNPWQTLHRVGKKIFFLGQDADKSRGIEMWVYNPDRCTNALTLASYDEDRYNSELNTEESKREIHYLSNTTITATNKITNATVLYRAGQSVTFLPGFQAGLSPADMYAPAGKGSFEAQIGGCGTLVPR
jgi:hypothetical protein